MVFVLVVFGGFLDVPRGHIARKVKWHVKLQVFATLMLGARGRSNIFQHQTASARCLAVSILFQGGPGIGPAKRIQNRFRLGGVPAVRCGWNFACRNLVSLAAYLSELTLT